MQRALLRRVVRHARPFCATPAPPGTGPNHRSVMALDGNTIRPFIQPNAFVAPSASVIGSVTINDHSAVMYGAVVRGDLALIQLGAHVVIGDNATLSAGAVEGALSPAEAATVGLSVQPELKVGDYSAVGANARLHSCWLEGDNVVGHCATIGEGARLARYARVQAGAVVEDGADIPEGEVWGGVPAVKVGDVDADERVSGRKRARNSMNMVGSHMYEFLPVGTAYWEKEKIERERIAQ